MIKKNDKICVYTCITGDYDEMKEFPSVKEEGVDYYLFTNNNKIRSNFWKVIDIENDGLDNIRLARKIKVLGHSILDDYEITVWLDGASYLKDYVTKFIDQYCDLKTYSLIGFKHRERDCIYDEALECVKVKKEKREILERQILKYRKEGYPEHNGLIESTVLIRRNHDKKLKKVMEDWFAEIQEFSYRDQISFNYVATKNHLNYKLLDMNVFDNEYFGWEKHPSKKVLKNYSVYFGSDLEFDFDSLFLGSYEIHDGIYTARFKCMKSVGEFKIEFATFCGIVFSDLEVHGKNIQRKNLVNYNQYFEYQIFDKENPTLFLYGDFRKGQVFEISIRMEIMKEDFYFQLLKRFNETLVACLNQNQNRTMKDRIKGVMKRKFYH